MSELSFIYLIYPLVILILIILSKDTELPPGIEDTGISRIYLKISMYLFKWFKKRKRTYSVEKIRVYLSCLYHRKDMDNAEAEYFIRKISIALLLGTAGSFLSFMLSISAGNGGQINPDNTLTRKAFGEKDYGADLVASDGVGNVLGEYELDVLTRAYTREEAEELFEQASEEIEIIMLGENTSLDEVRSDLNLPEKMEGYPFDISWRVDNYEVMHFDGRLIEENIPEEGVVVSLDAKFSYRGDTWRKEMHAYVMREAQSPGERAFKGIQALLTKADEESLEDEKIILPSEYEGREIVWTEKITDNSALLMILALVGGVASFVLKDRELKKAIDDRQEQMLKDYPQFVSQLVLYMGAGMSMRNILSRLSNIYLRDRKNGAKKSYLYEEILRTNRELAAGSSEAGAYEQLGIRISSRQYTRLVTLLSQNLRKGNSELLDLLRQESAKAFEERMDRVRKIGEEAGTKLLMPMMIMLLIVMVIIMIPAYMAF